MIGDRWRDARLIASMKTGCFLRRRRFAGLCPGRAGPVRERRPGERSASLDGRPVGRQHAPQKSRLTAFGTEGVERSRGHAPGPFGGMIFVETHKAIDFRLSEHARRCPLEATVALVR